MDQEGNETTSNQHQLVEESEDEELSDASMEEVSDESSVDEDDADPRFHSVDFMQYLLRTRFLERRVASNSCDELINGLKDRGTFKKEIVGEAMKAIPREYFVTKDLQEDAYSDHPLRFSKMGFNISAPHMYAIALDSLNLKKGMTFLDIGSGSAHMTALGAYIVGPTGLSHGVEVRQEIIDFSQKFLNRYQKKFPEVDISSLRLEARNCFLPSFENYTYDRIHVGACCPSDKLEYLISLLNPKGVLVTPYGDKLIRVKKAADGTSTRESLAAVRYGDLIIPSQAEIKEALNEIERKKASIIDIPTSTIFDNLENFVNNEQFHDVEFNLSGETVFAHRFLLETFSAYFKELLNNSKDGEIAKIDIAAKKPIFVEYLRYVYTGKISLDDINVAGLKEIAKAWNLPKLKYACVKFEKTQELPNVDNSSKIVELRNLVNCNHKSNIIFNVGGSEIVGHKTILQMRCPYFSTIFNSGYIEASSKTIEIPHISYDIFVEILNWIYCGSINKNKEDENYVQTILEILEVANYFDLQDLVASCSSILYENIDTENACTLLQIANRYQAKQLNSACFEWVLQNYEEVTKTKSFSKLDRDLLLDLTTAAFTLIRNYRQ